MTYREDLDAAHSRVAALEKDLSDAKQEISELRGERQTSLTRREETALAKKSNAHSSFFGGPKELQLEATVEGVVSDEDFVDIVDCIRRHLGSAGMVSSLAGSLTWHQGSGVSNAGRAVTTISVLSRKGVTNIRIDQNFRATGGAIFGAVGGGLGINLAVHSTIWLSVAGFVGLGLAAGPAALGVSYLGCRRLFRRSVRKRTRYLNELLEDLVALTHTLAKASE